MITPTPLAFRLAGDHGRLCLTVAMARLNLNGKTLAQSVGCAASTISALRTVPGKRCSPELATRIATAVEIHIDILFAPAHLQDSA